MNGYNTTVGIANLTLTNGIDNRMGGGIYIDGSFTATNSTITGNKAQYGGGVHVDVFGTFTAINTTITGNTAQSGGGVCVGGVNRTFIATNSTITGNTAQYGGGVCVAGLNKTFIATNSIIALNTDGKDIDGEGAFSGTNNLLTDNFGDGNYQYDPTKPLFVNAAKGDYSLAKGSQAIDRGDSEKAKEAGLTDASIDLADNPRIVGVNIDIGAYESSYDATVVDTTSDSFDPNDDEWSLREAIAYAAEYATDDVTITFAQKLNGGQITLGGEELSINKSIKLDASDLSEGITISADGRSRIFNVASNLDVEIRGVTFKGGVVGTLDMPENGGAIYNAGNLKLNNVAFQYNIATKNGGAIFNNYDATLTINNGIFEYNFANNGGAFANYGTTTISGDYETTISYNTATKFGGAYFGCGELTVKGKTSFTSNNAGIKGGAIYNDVNKSDVDNPRPGKVTITGDDVSFVGNTAGERGGAIQTYSTLILGGKATFSGNKVNGDEVDRYGGAIDVGEGGSAMLSGDLTFENNTADFGGAIFSVGALKFESGEENQYAFTCNTANKSGGAIDALAGKLALGGSFEFTSNKANGTYVDASEDYLDKTGLGGALAITTPKDDTKAEGANFVWNGNSAENGRGNCVAFKEDCGISAETFGLKDDADYVMFKELAEKFALSQSLLPLSISPNAVKASITVEGVKTPFGAEGVTPQQLGLGVGTHEALVQYVDANGGTSATYVLKLTVVPGASVEVRETAIADGRGLKFDFNLTKADGGAVSVWEISWGDGSTTRSENLSESWLAAHYYAQDGTFDVSLKVVYIDGTSETFEAFSTQKIGASVAKTEALSAVFEDVDDLFEDAFVDFENPNVYGPAFLR